MEQRDIDMTVALFERHIQTWEKQSAEATRLMDKEQAHQCNTAVHALRTVKAQFLHANT
jgi:hypothetical protein